MYFPPSPAEQPPVLLDALVEAYDRLAASLHLPLIDRELHDALFLSDLRAHVKELHAKKKNPQRNLSATVAGLLADNRLGPKAEALQLVVDRLLQVQRRTVTVIACMEHRESILASLIRTNNFYEKNGCTLDDAQQTFLHALQEYQIVTLLVTEAIFQWRELLSRPMPFLLRNGEDCLRRIQADSAALACCAVGQSLSLRSERFPCLSNMDIPKIRRRQQMLRKARLINTKAVLQRGFDPVEAPKSHYDSKPPCIYGAPTLWRRGQVEKGCRGPASTVGSGVSPRSQRHAAAGTGGEPMATALEQLAAMLQENSSGGPKAMGRFCTDAFSTSTGGSPSKTGALREKRAQKGKESRLGAAEKLITGENALQARLTEELWVAADEHDCFVPLLPIPELFATSALPAKKGGADGKTAKGQRPPLPDDALPLNKSGWAELFNTTFFQTRARTKSRMSMNSEAVVIAPGQQHSKAAARALNFAAGGKRTLLSSASSHSSFSRSASSDSSDASSSARRDRRTPHKAAAHKAPQRHEANSSSDDFEKESSSSSSPSSSSSSSAASSRKSSSASKHSSHSNKSSHSSRHRRASSTAAKEETEASAASAAPQEATPNAHATPNATVDTWSIPHPVPVPVPVPAPVPVPTASGPATPAHPPSSSHSSPPSNLLQQNRRLSASLEKLRMQVLQERGLSVSQRDDVATGEDESAAASFSRRENSSAKVSSAAGASPIVSPTPVPAEASPIVPPTPVPAVVEQETDTAEPPSSMKPPSSRGSSSRKPSNKTSSNASRSPTMEEQEKEESPSVADSSKKAESPLHTAARKVSTSAAAYSDDFEETSITKKSSSRAASPSAASSPKKAKDRSVSLDLPSNRKNSTSTGGAYSADFISDEDEDEHKKEKKSASASAIKSSVASSSTASSPMAKAKKKSVSSSSSSKESSASTSKKSSASSSPIKANKMAHSTSSSSSSSPASSRASSAKARAAPVGADKDTDSSIGDDASSSSAKSTTDSDASSRKQKNKKANNKAVAGDGSMSSITFSSVEAW